MMMFRLWQNALLDKVSVPRLATFSADLGHLRLPSRADSTHFSLLIGPQPLCPKELWHFVHQCYGNELGLTSDDEDYVPPDDDFNTMG